MIGKQNVFIVIGLVALLISCSKLSSGVEEYLDHVGDTRFDETIDDPEYEVCHDDQVLQYYNFSKAIQYRGEKFALVKKFEEDYTLEKRTGENGYITIRFVVNCHGKTGWFRVEEVDQAYVEKKFSKEIPQRILQITKSLDGWQTGQYDGEIYDYYQYLTFKINDGLITQIMP